MKTPEPQTLEDRLRTLLEQGRPLSVRELVAALGLHGDERRALKPVLARLLDSGDAVRMRGARIGLPARMDLVVGRLTCNPAGYGFVAPERGEGPHVYISPTHLLDALHGDRVVARVERVAAKGPEGRIVRILERGMERLVGRYEPEGAGGRVVPFDRRILVELTVPPGQSGGAHAGDMVHAEITRPPSANRRPQGRVLRVLGKLEDKGVDIAVVLAKYDLPEAFPADCEAEAARVPRAVSEDDLRGRTDFRSWLTVTVDPATARDHDDAIGLLEATAPDGGKRWLLAVHIADVAHYVRPGSRIDEEAYARGTSVYFPDLVVPMLPHALSSHICSLVPDEDRLTQSVLLEMDAEGAVLRTEFHDGVIRSAARLSYGVAQKIVDADAETLAGQRADVADLVRRMDELSRVLRRRRYARGSLDFDLPAPELILSDAGEVTGIVATERLDSMRAIEEFMLAANEAVATALTAGGAPALHRIHEVPDPQRVEEFAELVTTFGYPFPAEADAVRPQHFQALLQKLEGKPEEKFVSFLLLRTMRLARYHPEGLGHFGLATASYSHFTSPIRRYPDLVVHRALRAMRHRQPPATGLLEALPEMARHLSDRERVATDAERELLEWKKVRFMAGKVGETLAGYVTGVQGFGLFVDLTDVYVQGLVHVSSMTDDYYAFDERGHRLVGQNTGRAFRLGDRVEVQVLRVDLERRQVDLGIMEILRRAATRPERPGARPASDARPPARGSRGSAAGSRGRSEGPKAPDPASRPRRRSRRLT